MFYRLLARIKPLGWHVVLHFDAGDMLEQRELLERIDVPFIIDHMGRVKAADGLEQKPFQALLALYRANPLAWIKICGAERVSVGKRPFRDAVPFAQALIAIDAGRLLWGTDWPHPNITQDMPNDGELVDLLGEMCPDARCATGSWSIIPTRMYWELSRMSRRASVFSVSAKWGSASRRICAPAMRGVELAAFDLLLHQAAAGDAMRRHAAAAPRGTHAPMRPRWRMAAR